MNQLKHLIALLVPLTVLHIEPRQQLLTQTLLGQAFKASHDNCIQVTVANQFNMPGSETDCGYHALFNGLAIADLIQASPDGFNAGCIRLGDTKVAVDARIKIFGSHDSAWRKKVVEIRANKKASKKIAEALVKGIDPSVTVEMRTAVRKVIDKAALDLASNSHIVHAVDDVQYLANPLIIKKHLKSALKAKIKDPTVDPGPKKAYKKLREEGIDLVVNITDVRCSVERDSATWLFSEEITALSREIPQEEFKATLSEHNFFLLGDTIDFNQPIASDRKTQEDQFKQLQADMQHPDSNVLAVILLYTKESPDLFDWLEPITSRFSWMKPTRTEAEEIDSATASASNGHWITLVVNKIGVDTQFITADSGGNRTRLKDKRVHEVISLLTGDTVKSSSKEFKEANQRSARTSWREWQKPIKIVLSTVAMIAASFIIAKTMNKKEQKAQKSS